MKKLILFSLLITFVLISSCGKFGCPGPTIKQFITLSDSTKKVIKSGKIDESPIEVVMSPDNLFKLSLFIEQFENESANNNIIYLSPDDVKSILQELRKSKKLYGIHQVISKRIDSVIKKGLDIKDINDEYKLNNLSDPMKYSINSFLDRLIKEYGYCNGCTPIDFDDELTTVGNCKKTVFSKISIK